MMRMLGKLGVLGALLLLTACGTMSQTGSHQMADNRLAEERWAGVVTAVQTDEVRRLMGNRNVDAYFIDLRNWVRARRDGFRGATGNVTLTIRVADRVYWTEQVTLDQFGMASARVPAGTPIPNMAALCVETPWSIVQNQVPYFDFATADQNVACTADGWLSRYFRSDRHPTMDETGRGRRQGDRANVAAVRRAG